MRRAEVDTTRPTGQASFNLVDQVIGRTAKGESAEQRVGDGSSRGIPVASGHGLGDRCDGVRERLGGHAVELTDDRDVGRCPPSRFINCRVAVLIDDCDRAHDDADARRIAVLL